MPLEWTCNTSIHAHTTKVLQVCVTLLCFPLVYIATSGHSYIPCFIPLVMYCSLRIVSMQQLENREAICRSCGSADSSRSPDLYDCACGSCSMMIPYFYNWFSSIWFSSIASLHIHTLLCISCLSTILTIPSLMYACIVLRGTACPSVHSTWYTRIELNMEYTIYIYNNKNI